VRLVVVLSVDQLRADYLTRFAESFLPAEDKDGVGGFNYLAGHGAVFGAATVAHIPTTTGPGHATLLTGSAPCLDGIVNNSWWDRAAGKVRTCVEDDAESTVGGRARSVSPRALLVTTVGDELKLATAGAARVVAVSFKDRPAIFMGGHAADVVIWFDEDSGNWVTSSFYAAGGKLPAWVAEANATRPADAWAGTSWQPLLPAPAYRLTVASAAAGPGVAFSHPLGGTPAADRAYREAAVSGGPGAEIFFSVATRAVAAESLGRHEVPDLLALSFSTTDYAGHDYGPNSPEIMDVMVRADRALAGFLRGLDRSVPGGLASVIVAVSADHGVAPVPEQAGALARLPVVRAASRDAADVVEAALDTACGAGDWVLAFTRTEPNLYLNRELAASCGLDMAVVERAAADAAAAVPGVLAAFTRTQIMAGQLPAWPWVARVTLGFHPQRSGDVVVVTAPGVLPTGARVGTSHGTPWPPDTDVPLILAGPGIRSGRYLEPVSTMDLAPTLSELLAIARPSGCLGRPLAPALAPR
jgi:hypothetical protein